MGLGADKGAGRPGPFCRGHGAAVVEEPNVRREDPAEASVPSPGSRAGPVCEPRVQEDAVVAFCRLLSSFPITLRAQPPAPPAPVLCHPARLGAAFARFSIRKAKYEKEKSCVYRLIFSSLGKKKVKRSQPVSEI